MSAICGIFNLDESNVSLENSKGMLDKLKFYTFDYLNVWSKEKIFLGCGVQCITPESKYEKLPLYDKDNLLSITADAIIDNRKELLSTFNVSEVMWSETTDSDLILRSFVKWGKECPKYLVGDFSFAIWDGKKQELFCARDHTGTRTFYYKCTNEVFAFCTVIKPIFSVFRDEVSLNDRWVADFLALPLTLQQIQSSETIYETIYELPPATSMVINSKGITQTKFWDPLKEVKPLKLKDDEAYEEAFRKVFSEAVNCRLRTEGEVGIRLSGGMDSGSVASVAATELQKKGKKLIAYSSVPMLEYKGKPLTYDIVDESEYIEEIKNEHENLQLNYFRSEGQNSLTNLDSIIDVLEQPHKIVENMFWYNGLMEAASKKKCKIILNGQFGNYTISFGDFPTSILSLYRKCKFIKIVKEINGHSRIYKIPKIRIAKAILKVIEPYNLRKFLSLKLYKNANKFESNLVNKDLVTKYDLKKRFSIAGYFSEIDRYYDHDESKEFSIYPFVFSQIGTIETKMGLAYGVVERDPTRDKRVIEFCFSLPIEQFVRNGVDRRMIRKAMDGILPDKIRLNNSRRGLQSVDWVQRLESDWSNIYIRLKEMLNNSKLYPYIDKDKLQKDLLLVGEVFDEDNFVVIRRLLVLLIFSEFLKNQYK